MRPIGFSTGAVAKADFRRALEVLRPFVLPAVELSALRLAELEPLVTALEDMDLSGYEYVSFHAPSRLDVVDEPGVVRELLRVAELGFAVVAHPDVLFSPGLWRQLGSSLLIENMDKRKPIGRTAKDIADLFEVFPAAGFCFDIAHVRQVDPTMTEARFMLSAAGERLRQVHISELNTQSRHEPISAYAISAYQSVAARIPETIPVIIETLIDQGQSDVATEVERARRSLDWQSGKRQALAG